MANQSNRTGSTPSSAAGKRPSTGRYTAIMWAGGLIALVGMYLVFGNYSSHPTKFYIGLVLALAGGLAGFVSAIIRSTIRNRAPRKR